MNSKSRPLILLDPHPRPIDLIFDAPTKARLEQLGEVVGHGGPPADDSHIERYLPQAIALIGQSALPKERLDRAPKLKAIFNVETNFLPNIDYEHCQTHGIYVLSPTSSFAQAVAESALAMAIDLARGITAADRAFRAGGEAYGLDANEGCFMFAGASVGIIGFGDLGRNLRALLTPFRNPVAVYDPWLPEDVIRAHDCRPAGLDEVLSSSRIIF